MKHYRFGSSSAKRTNNCAGWHVLSKDLPERPAGAAAEFGTKVHTLLEHLALETLTPVSIGDQVGKGYEQEHVDMALKMWELTLDILDKFEIDWYEPEVTGVVGNDVGGTLDLIGGGKKSMLLLDYKTGAGVQVDPTENDQILFAAWACRKNSTLSRELMRADNFMGVIIQPTLDGEVIAKEWAFTVADVDAFGSRHSMAIENARKGGDPNPGDHCKFCPAATVCPAKLGAVRQALMMKPDQLDTLSEQMALTDTVLEWVAAVKQRVEEQLALGATVNGYKLVEKRAVEKWADEQTVASRHPELLTKLATPAQARKLGINTEGLTVKESSGTTIAKESDKRPAVLNTEGLAASLNAAR